jgi:succinoglycan biosynthesis protein ExoM
MSATIDVCICTHQRASLADTLRSIATQRLSVETTVRIIIADNDETPSAREIVQRAQSELGLDCLYVHAPAHNISTARNACLDAATAPLIAFIDDDETATEYWLMKLLASRRLSGATITFGPVRAIYTTGPAWLRIADLHSIVPVIYEGGRIETGYSSNVLIDREALAEQLRICRFDPELGRSGGEDTSFFYCLHSLGARLGFCLDAFVNELVSPRRTHLSWLLKRSFRSGQTHGRILIGGGRNRLAMTVVAITKLVYCLVGTCVLVASPPGWRRYLVRSALHLGVVAKVIGMRDLRLY